ncbi:hypothetical protein [Agrobacterium tumefaciens]|uniref:hypothetical protein n=1 Tax=Agrobacterium tumefaciens TaxID=358 RepID=UPI001586676E|nr:hypothetical protein [Agrobacterium tumefaciens]
MVAATSDASCVSLETSTDVLVALSWVEVVSSVVEIREAISCRELLVALALFRAVTCADVMAATWPGVKAAAWDAVRAASVPVPNPEIVLELRLMICSVENAVRSSPPWR